MTWQDVKISDDRGMLRVSGSADVVDVHIALRAHFIKRRGVELTPGAAPIDGLPVEVMVESFVFTP